MTLAEINATFEQAKKDFAAASTAFLKAKGDLARAQQQLVDALARHRENLPPYSSHNTQVVQNPDKDHSTD